MQRFESLEKTLMLGKIEGRRSGQHRIRWLDGITYSMVINLSKLQATVEGRGARCATAHDITESQTQLSNWITTTIKFISWNFCFNQNNWLDHKESWALKNWCFWTVVLEKTLESPLDCKEIKLVNPKGNQSWIFIGRTDTEAPILWPPDGKNWLIGKDPDAGKDWRQDEKRMTEDEMVGWHHQLDGHEFEQTLGSGDGQENLAWCSPWCHKELDTTEWLNGNELN